MRRVLLGLAALALPAAAQPALHDLALEASAQARAVPVDARDFTWEWPTAPRWLDGAPFNLQGFGGGLDFGDPIFGSTVPNAEAPPIEIVFDRDLRSTLWVYDRSQDYAYVGTGTFPGAAYDVSDPSAPRRLNLALSEAPTLKAANRRWDPDGSDLGGREYLAVLASTYDGASSPPPSPSFFGLNSYYDLIGRLVAGAAPIDKFPDATLTVTPRPVRRVSATTTANGVVSVQWVAAAYLDGARVRVYDVTDSGDPALLTETEPGAGDFLVSGLDPGTHYTFRVDLVTADGQTLGSDAASATPSLSQSVLAAASFSSPHGQSGSYGDVWGYTAPDGREYALLALRNAGLSVIDVTDAPAAAPVEVGFVPTVEGASDSKDVKVYGHYAYLINEVGPVQIIDLSDPAAPVQVGTLDVQPGLSNGGAHNALVAEGYLWVVGGRQDGTAGVRVYSLADPTVPAYVGGFQPTHQPNVYYHDFEVRGTLGFGSAIYNGGGVDVLDVSDPADISLLTTFTYPGAGAHNTCTTPDGHYVFVGDEIGTGGNWIRTFDLRDLETIELVDQIVVNTRAVVHNCYVLGDELYVAHYTEGLRVFNIADPTAPAEVAFYDTFQGDGFGYNGAWNVYPYFASGKVIVSDIQTGLFVIRLDPAAVNVEAPPAELVPLSVAPNPIPGSATVRYDLTERATVHLAVYDVQGREVAVLYDGARPAGPHRATLREGLPAGVYLVRLRVDGRDVATRPVTVLR